VEDEAINADWVVAVMQEAGNRLNIIIVRRVALQAGVVLVHRLKFRGLDGAERNPGLTSQSPLCARSGSLVLGYFRFCRFLWFIT